MAYGVSIARFMTPKFDLSLLPVSPDLSFEIPLWEKGLHHIAGIDEAGRGALAGPVSAAAIILPPDPTLDRLLEGVRDSKQMTPVQRAFWEDRLKEVALAWGIGFASNCEIDDLGIVQATRLAVRRALEQLSLEPDHLLIDYLDLPGTPIPLTPLVKGDARSLTIASASILAKTGRDALLCEMDSRYPGYGFADHKGYGTPAHLSVLETLGPCPIHRRSFAPLKPPL
jgi:ribonuclease HII